MITLRFLRVGVENANEWRRRVSELRMKVWEARTDEEASRALGRLGDQLRLCPEKVEEAVTVLREAVRRGDEAGAGRLLASNQLRLAIALQYADRHEEAFDHHRRAADLIAEWRAEELEDFSLQHRGKCHAEIGQLSKARECFEKALEMRRARGRPDLEAWTLKALAHLEERGKAETTD